MPEANLSDKEILDWLQLSIDPEKQKQTNGNAYLCLEVRMYNFQTVREAISSMVLAGQVKYIDLGIIE